MTASFPSNPNTTAARPTWATWEMDQSRGLRPHLSAMRGQGRWILDPGASARIAPLGVQDLLLHLRGGDCLQRPRPQSCVHTRVAICALPSPLTIRRLAMVIGVPTTIVAAASPRNGNEWEKNVMDEALHRVRQSPDSRLLWLPHAQGMDGRSGDHPAEDFHGPWRA